MPLILLAHPCALRKLLRTPSGVPIQLVHVSIFHSGTQDVTNIENDVEFEDYHFSRDLLAGIYEKGFERPSPIQEAAIPFAMVQRDILARAKNGTGKTAAFCIPILEMVTTDKNHIQGALSAHACTQD